MNSPLIALFHKLYPIHASKPTEFPRQVPDVLQKYMALRCGGGIITSLLVVLE
jgi:hypothetical protein